MPLFRRKQRHMPPSQPISDNRALALIDAEKRGDIKESDAALLEVWRFHRRPTKRYQFSFVKRCIFALSEYGDRLGRFEDLGGKGIHVHGDNGIKYYGLKDKIDRQSLTMVAVAHYSHWDDIERRQRGDEAPESEFLPLTSERAITKLSNMPRRFNWQRK